MNSQEKDYSIFAGSKFIESLRSGGYKDTSYAIGELVDNSIDAGAKHVDILCLEKYNPSTSRYYLDKIAVLDDGSGMNEIELRNSLLFGDGTRGDNPHDMGKYGMGLPNASLSQCKKVEVFSWQNGSETLCTYIDVDEVKNGKKVVPKPRPKKIPKTWKNMTKNWVKSGTLVVWSNLDRCSWTKSKTLIKHSEFLIGRIYRRFLAKKSIKIILIVGQANNDVIVEHNTTKMLPNDPMYLMAPSSTPKPWGDKPMFKKDIDFEQSFEIDYAGKKHKITARFSLERDELRGSSVEDQGHKKHAQHARQNTGVSIMRADREITLDTNLIAGSDPRERWWGVEVDIPTSLDLAVGLTNNKQQADILSSMMRTINRFEEEDEDEGTLLDELLEQDKTKKQLLYMIRNIHARIRSMQRRIRATRAGTRSNNKTSVDSKINKGYELGMSKGERSQTDDDRESKDAEQRIAIITKAKISDGINKSMASDIAKNWVEEDKKIAFIEAELDGKNFFSVDRLAGVVQVKVNSKHKAYKNLYALVNKNENEYLSDKDRLELTQDGLRLLLASWARYEDLMENTEKRETIQDIRYDWGREMDNFLRQNEV